MCCLLLYFMIFLINAINIWNTTYLHQITEHLKVTQGMDDNLLRHIAHLGLEHINFLGVYNFDGKNTPVENIPRPLIFIIFQNIFCIKP